MLNTEVAKRAARACTNPNGLGLCLAEKKDDTLLSFFLKSLYFFSKVRHGTTKTKESIPLFREQGN